MEVDAGGHHVVGWKYFIDCLKKLAGFPSLEHVYFDFSTMDPLPSDVTKLKNTIVRFVKESKIGRKATLHLGDISGDNSPWDLVSSPSQERADDLPLASETIRRDANSECVQDVTFGNSGDSCAKAGLYKRPEGLARCLHLPLHTMNQAAIRLPPSKGATISLISHVESSNSTSCLSAYASSLARTPFSLASLTRSPSLRHVQPRFSTSVLGRAAAMQRTLPRMHVSRSPYPLLLRPYSIKVLTYRPRLTTDWWRARSH